MLKLRKVDPGEPLVVSMTGLRLGDRVLVMGGAQPKAIALIALKPGLTGRVCLVEESAECTAAAAARAEAEGALIEPFTAPFTELPFAAGEFDAVIGNRILSQAPAARDVAVLGEALRVLRPAGRCILIEARRSGIAALFGCGGIPASDAEAAMSAAGFGGTRTLAERDGLLFVEGAKKKG